MPDPTDLPPELLTIVLDLALHDEPDIQRLSSLSSQSQMARSLVGPNLLRMDLQWCTTTVHDPLEIPDDSAQQCPSGGPGTNPEHRQLGVLPFSCSQARSGPPATTRGIETGQ